MGAKALVYLGARVSAKSWVCGVVWSPPGSSCRDTRVLVVAGIRHERRAGEKVHVNDFVEKRRKDRGGARATIASRGREQGGGSGKEDHVFEDKCTRGRKGKGTTHHRDVQGQDGDPDASWVLVSP